MNLAVGTLEALGRATLILPVANHVAAVLVRAVAPGTRVSRRRGTVEVGVYPALVGETCKKKEEDGLVSRRRQILARRSMSGW